MSSKINRVLIIGYLFLALSFVIGIILFFGVLIHGFAVEPTIQPVSSVAPTQTVQPAAASTPVASAPDAPVEAIQPKAQVAPATAPVAPSYKWAETMSGAGISASDYGYVTDMVLSDQGWRTNGANLWQHANQANEGNSEPLVWNIGRVNHYVIATYGTWSAAHDAWVSGGDF